MDAGTVPCNFQGGLSAETPCSVSVKASCVPASCNTAFPCEFPAWFAASCRWLQRLVRIEGQLLVQHVSAAKSCSATSRQTVLDRLVRHMHLPTFRFAYLVCRHVSSASLVVDQHSAHSTTLSTQATRPLQGTAWKSSPELSLIIFVTHDLTESEHVLC